MQFLPSKCASSMGHAFLGAAAVMWSKRPNGEWAPPSPNSPPIGRYHGMQAIFGSLTTSEHTWATLVDKKSPRVLYFFNIFNCVDRLRFRQKCVSMLTKA